MVEIRKTIYTMVGKAEKDIRTKEGFLGGLAQAAESAVKAGKEAVQTVKGEVEARGGLGKIVDDATDRLSDVVGRHSDGAEQVLDKTAERANGLYDVVEKKIRNAFFTDDKFDGGKARESLKDGAKVAQEYGVKAAKVLAKYGKMGAEVVVNDFRRHVPSQEDRNGVYAGIGTAYDGFLMRENYDACLKFATQLDKKLPENLMYRKTIIADAKASASENMTELVAYYATKGGKPAKMKLDKLKPVLKKFK